jgi:hypothetical protein
MKKKSHAPKIGGFDYKDYAALVLFVDAFLDVTKKEYPAIAEKVSQPNHDLVEGVWNFFKDQDIDPMPFVDRRPAHVMVKNVDELWAGKITVADLVRFDKETIGTLALQAVGHDVSLGDDPRVKDFLANADVEAPTTEELGIDMDPKRFEGVYKALEQVTEDSTSDQDDDTSVEKDSEKSTEKHGTKRDKVESVWKSRNPGSRNLSTKLERPSAALRERNSFLRSRTKPFPRTQLKLGESKMSLVGSLVVNGQLPPLDHLPEADKSAFQAWLQQPSLRDIEQIVSEPKIVGSVSVWFVRLKLDSEYRGFAEAVQLLSGQIAFTLLRVEHRPNIDYKSASRKWQRESHDILSEATGLKSFLHSLIPVVQPEHKHKDMEKKVKEIVEGVLKAHKLKYHLKEDRSADGIFLRYSISINGEPCVIKTFLAYESEYMSAVLWSKDEQNMKQVVAIGGLDDFHALKAVAKIRFKHWLEKQNGS